MSKIHSFAIVAIIVSMFTLSCKKDNAVTVAVNKGTITGMISNTATSFNVSNENIYLEKFVQFALIRVINFPQCNHQKFQSEKRNKKLTTGYKPLVSGISAN